MAASDRKPVLNLYLNLGASARPACSRPLVEIRSVNVRLTNVGHKNFPPAFVDGFHDEVLASQILEQFGEWFPAIEHRGYRLGIRPRELEKTE